MPQPISISVSLRWSRPLKISYQLGQRHAAHGIGGALEQHLDLGVIALRGILCQPAAGLVMEILQIVIRAACRALFPSST